MELGFQPLPDGNSAFGALIDMYEFAPNGVT